MRPGHGQADNQGNGFYFSSILGSQYLIPASDKCLDSTSQLQRSYTKRDTPKINQARHLVSSLAGTQRTTGLRSHVLYIINSQGKRKSNSFTRISSILWTIHGFKLFLQVFQKGQTILPFHTTSFQ